MTGKMTTVMSICQRNCGLLVARSRVQAMPQLNSGYAVPTDAYTLLDPDGVVLNAKLANLSSAVPNQR